MEDKRLCKCDAIRLLRCGQSSRERPARVEWAGDYAFVPTVRLLGFLPWPVRGVWLLSDEGKTWVRQ